MVVFRYEKLTEFCYVCGKLDHLDKDCPIVFVEEGVSIKENRRYQMWLKADGFKGVTLEDCSGKFKGKEKLKEIIYDEEEDRQEQEGEREDIAIQLVNADADQSMRQQGTRSCLEPMGSRYARSRNAGGLENVVQGNAAGMGVLVGNSEFNFPSFGNICGNSHGMQMPGHYEQFGSINTGVDWANLQLWGGVSMPMERGGNAGGGNFQQMNNVQDLLLNMD